MRCLFFFNNQQLEKGPFKISITTESNGIFRINRGQPIIIATNYRSNNLISNRLETWSWPIVEYNSSLFLTLNNIIKYNNYLNIMIKYVKINNGMLDYDTISYQAILKDYNISVNQFIFKGGQISYNYELTLRCF